MILVTGCTGYIGSHLVHALLRSGRAVRGLVRPDEYVQAQHLVEAGMECWKGDLLEPETLRGIEQGVTTVYHLAGLHSLSVQRISDVYVTGTGNLLHVFVDARSHTLSSLQAFVISSNPSPYGDCGDDWVTEERPPDLVHPFGRITHQMEQLLIAAYERSGLPAIILRIADVYGPEKQHSLLKYVGMEHFHLLGNGLNWASHIHISDLVQILILAPTFLWAGQLYNVGDDFPVRQRDLYEDLAVKFAVPQPQWIPLQTSSERLKLSVHGLRALSVRLSNQKLKKELPFSLQYPTYLQGCLASIAEQEIGYNGIGKRSL